MLTGPQLARPTAWAAALLTATAIASGATLRAADERTIAAALLSLQPGDTLAIDAGTYAGDFRVSGLAGTALAPITIRGTDPAAPPIFQAGSEAFRFSSCSYLKLKDLRVLGLTTNGIAIDDGGTPETPSHHIVLESIAISEIGLRGKHHAINLTGVDDVIVRRCSFEAWGGAAIALSRCRRAFISDCEFIGRENVNRATAVSIRGGSSNVLVQSSFFRWAGDQAISIGGDTNAVIPYPAGVPYEATAVEVAGNRIFGSLAPIAWVTADGGYVHDNTIMFPHRWVMRILQRVSETNALPCHGGIFANNVVLYDERVATIVNIGNGTYPDSFVFVSNLWHRTAGPKALRLPAPAEGDLLQLDPEITMRGPSAYRIRSSDPRVLYRGADHYTPKPPPFTMP